MKTQTPTILKVKSTQAMQTKDNKATTGTQTDNPQPETNEHCVSRVNPDTVTQEEYVEYASNKETPIMTNTQLEAGHHMITEGIVTINQATMTESEEDTPLFR